MINLHDESYLLTCHGCGEEKMMSIRQILCRDCHGLPRRIIKEHPKKPQVSVKTTSGGLPSLGKNRP